MTTAAPTLTLWTLQHPDVWRVLQETGVYRADGDRSVDAQDFPHAYDWIRRQMALRVPGATDRYPVWAGLRPCPTPRAPIFYHHLGAGDEVVRLTLRVARERVLLSEYDEWHMVLNGSYLALSEADDDAFDDTWRARGVRTANVQHHRDLPPEMVAAVEASWEQVFDLSPTLGDPEWRGNDRGARVQATLTEVRREDVVRVDLWRGHGPCAPSGSWVDCRHTITSTSLLPYRRPTRRRP